MQLQSVAVLGVCLVPVLSWILYIDRLKCVESQVDINTHTVAMGLEWAAQLLNINICYGVYTQLSLCTTSPIRDSSAHWRESEVIDVTVYVCTLHIHRKVVYTIELKKLSYSILPLDSTYFSSNLRVQSKADRLWTYYHLSIICSNARSRFTWVMAGHQFISFSNKEEHVLCRG